MVMALLRQRKWLALLLVLSLAGNVFLGGLYAGAWLGEKDGTEEASGDGKGGDAKDQPGLRILRRMAEALPEGERASFEAAIAGERDKLLAASLAMKDAREKVRAVIKAEPFDRAQLDAAFADMRDKSRIFFEMMHGVMANAVEKLSPEARHKLSEMEWRGWRDRR